MEISILPNKFLKKDNTFDKDSAIKLCGKIAGICYDKEGFSHLDKEPEDKTLKRVERTLNCGHHSVYDHILINFNLKNIPKILAMVLNNEHQYTTSEKSARYTPIIREETSIISIDEEKLYNKWVLIFKDKIKDKYNDIYNDLKIQRLAQENARYLITVFMPTEMVYSTTLRQINYIASWMKDYIKKVDIKNSFEKRLAHSMEEFLECLSKLNVLEEGLLKNEKYRCLSLFGKDLDKKEDYYGDVYITIYKGSFAQLAQAHRHRTLDYKIEMLDKFECFVPPIIEDDLSLVDEWILDMKSVKDIFPQGELINICEMGKYEDFILKCKERLCSEAQLEIMNQTKNILEKYKKSLEDKNHPLAIDIKKYTRGARCTFPDFKCKSDCKFKDGKLLFRKI